MSWFNRFTTGRITADAEVATVADRIRMFWKNTTQLAKYPHVLYAKPSNKVYLLDGLAYSTCGYFAICVVVFRAPQGRGKIRSNEQNVRSYYMLNHRMRGLLFRSKKKLLSAFGFYFFGKSIQKRPDSVCEDDVNNEKMFARIICQTIE